MTHPNDPSSPPSSIRACLVAFVNAKGDLSSVSLTDSITFNAAVELDSLQSKENDMVTKSFSSKCAAYVFLISQSDCVILFYLDTHFQK